MALRSITNLEMKTVVAVGVPIILLVLLMIVFAGIQCLFCRTLSKEENRGGNPGGDAADQV